MNIRAIGNKIIVKEDVKEATVGGIHVPNSLLPNGQIKATVVKTGDGVVLENGTVFPPRVNVGDSVWFDKREGLETTYNGEKLFVITENVILYVEDAK